MMTNKQRKVLHYAVLYAVIAVVVIVVDFPVYWMIKTSLTTVDKVMTRDVKLGIHEFDISSYINIWNSADYAARLEFRRYMFNSFAVVLVSSGISIVLASLAGYSLARFKYKKRETIAQGILYVYMFPQMILATPLLMLIIKLGLYDKLASLVLVYCTFSLPYSIWMMRSYFASLPKELEEAAMVDGCNRLQAVWRVMAPLALPGIVATITYSFIIGWSNVIYPLSFINSESKKMVSIGFLSLISGDFTPWNGVMAAATISSLPVVIVFLFLQKYLIGGLAAGGVKS
jgi:multiple sugar transport system permease protein